MVASEQHIPLSSLVIAKAGFDGSEHVGEVVEVKLERETDASVSVSYYVHYLELDKRLDEWVPASNVLEKLDPSKKAATLEKFPSNETNLKDGGSESLKMTRRQKRQYAEINHLSPSVDDLLPLDAELEKHHQEKTKVKNVQIIELGRHEIDTWYFSPYPEPHSSCNKLFICEYTLKYFRKKKTLLRHMAKLSLRCPPGDEIYRSPPRLGEFNRAAYTNPQISMFEVDGRKAKVYCQNLCLLSKLFLDHKTLYYDVDPFLFYVLCEVDKDGHHIVGYFSKEKDSSEGNNLACILTLPPYQRKGYGSFLIDFSYQLSKKEGRVGSPERPLSDLGAVSYRSYWTRVILETLNDSAKGGLSIKDISDRTSIRTEDVVRTLEGLSLIKFWKGDHVISATQKIIEEHMMTLKPSLRVDTLRLRYDPINVGDERKNR